MPCAAGGCAFAADAPGAGELPRCATAGGTDALCSPPCAVELCRAGVSAGACAVGLRTSCVLGAGGLSVASGLRSAGTGMSTNPPIVFAMYSAASTAAAIKHWRRTTRNFQNPVRNPGRPRDHSPAKNRTATASCRRRATAGSDLTREANQCGSPCRNTLLKNLSHARRTRSSFRGDNCAPRGSAPPSIGSHLLKSNRSAHDRRTAP